MADQQNEPNGVWDEYDWERFLQEQDRKTERYMELLEKYMDDPDRDQIIAKEMGWQHVLDLDESDWAESAEPAEKEERFEMHPLYQAGFALSVWLDRFLEKMDADAAGPAAVKMGNQIAIANSKLAAALSDDDCDEIGMTIAYLKRALKAVTNALDTVPQLVQELGLSKAQARNLNKRLFHIRDGTIESMGEHRARWRQRFG